MQIRKRLKALASISATAVLLLSAGTASAQEVKEIRVALQKGGLLAIAKQRQVLEQEFKQQNIEIKWYEFAYSNPLLEALNANKLDFGSAGSAPPIFAQAASENLVYAATQPAGLNSEGILVKKGSAIKGIDDLRGKRIGVAKGTSSHHFLVAALDKAKIKLDDIKVSYLAPSDATAAFDRGDIDAWVIWDPYLAIGERVHDARNITRDQRIVFSNNYLMANREFATRHPDLLKRLVDRLIDIGAWAEGNRGQLAQLLTDQTGIPLDIEKIVVERGTFGIKYLDDSITGQQQDVANRFADLGLVPRRVDVQKIVWKPAGR
ncbi:aliphatic sulfonate ABC transporter substrate-binding protein [Herbaspirillum sp. WKF16]|jgi:sulfonate transport system substrate-binding protein|uniref:aliphatic sulfonate ABC transporter substrate-binding protein n=1 Tax=Herbaspirillum sp. WKF16 TaxID=3028312 RepID=UPI0023A94D5A|nr:aliphatic sulfonate ABC transporter substrate-binding protein [Herbaspirillum sp. WKF16]WDZ94131.1 aliphatic sulfonate ABC transporter substrate-binding protein [Herbaspirillum sp. WKF16]